MIWLDPNRGYDIIGDVHGCANTLALLLEQMGYKLQRGVWQHPSRMALFLGDIVDRGPNIRKALHMVKNMVDTGQAICLMGNHEYYSLGWHTPNPDDPSQFIHPHTSRNQRVAAETLEQFKHYPDEWQVFLQWFYSLPLFVETARFRMVHACWDQQFINQFRQVYWGEHITHDFMLQTRYQDSFEHEVVDRLLLGLKLPLPDGQALVSKDGYIRQVFRAKFWAEAPETCGDVVFQPDALPHTVVNVPLSPEQRALCAMYAESEPLLFVGHYWCDGTPGPLQKNIACLDYSAVKYGKLVAYRLDDESQLDPNKFVWVEVKKPH